MNTVSVAISKHCSDFPGLSQPARQQQIWLNQWCEFKAGLSSNNKAFGKPVWKQLLFSLVVLVVHKLHTLALTFSQVIVFLIFTYGKNWKRKVHGSPILWFQTFTESANHLEYLRNTAGIKTLSTSENMAGITLNTDNAITLIKPLFHY